MANLRLTTPQTETLLYENKEIYHKNLKKHPDKSDTKRAE